MTPTAKFEWTLIIIVAAIWLGFALVLTFSDWREHEEVEKTEAASYGDQPAQNQHNSGCAPSSPYDKTEAARGERQKSYRSSQARLINIAAGLNVLTALAAFAGFGALYILYGTLEQTKTATKTAHDEYVASQRPWISIDEIKMNGPLAFGGPVGAPTGAMMGVNARLKNHGHSIALNIRFRMKLVADAGTFRDQEDALCKELGSVSDDVATYAIFPDESIPVSGGDMMKADAIAQSMAPWKKLNPNLTNIIPILVVCIDYRFSFGSEHHQTMYSYRIGGSQSKGGMVQAIIPHGIINDAVIVPADVNAN